MTIDSSPFLTSVARIELVESFELLEAVAVFGDRERLAHDGEQIDQHLAAQQVVDLVLARAVLLREPPQRRLLVVGVVVDVHGRDTAAAARR